jgi:peptide/histidine transporter 3/4
MQVLRNSIGDGEERQQDRGEQRPLLGTTSKRGRYVARLFLKKCCIRSKSALLILFWQLFITFTYGYVLEFGLVAATSIPYLWNYQQVDQFQVYATTLFALLAIVYLFYPLAGCLADIRCGRYKTVLYSLWIITGSGVLVCIGFTIISFYRYRILPLNIGSVIPISIGFGPPVILGIILSLSSSIAFSANVVQFGMDQLHDCPSEDSVLFIHWFAFTSHVGAAINKFAVIIIVYAYYRYVKFHTNYAPAYVVGFHALPIVAIILITVSIWIVRRKRHWFMVDSGSRNPYKLVYKVIKFATQHRSPIRRSAFTFCEDELPSRMDLAKEKYGGPFTTEQMEDVKAFLGILQVLLTLGPIFTTDTAANNMLYKFSNHLHKENFVQHISVPNVSYYLLVLIEYIEIGGLTEILIIMLIPLYLCVVRPFSRRYIPGMLKRIGLGIVIRILSLLSVFIIDTLGHIQDRTNNKCFIHTYYLEPLNISLWYLTLPYALNAINIMVFYIAAYEFICAQSPHAMKGLLIGTFFMVKGMFQLISVMITLVPFTTWKFVTSFPSCGFVYYLVNIVVAVIGLVAYSWVARRYQYRQRDEPDNIYRYAEEYYDKSQE